jgi:HrpA-like helicases
MNEDMNEINNNELNTIDPNSKTDKKKNKRNKKRNHIKKVRKERKLKKEKRKNEMEKKYVEPELICNNLVDNIEMPNKYSDIQYLKSLKIYKLLPFIWHNICENQVVEVNAGTGVGKTAGISRYILEACMSDNININKIFVSIPTIANVMYQYDYSMKNNEKKYCDNIGYAYAGLRSRNFQECKLVYATTQTVFNYLKNLKKKESKLLDKFIVMIDEAHHPSSENHMLKAFCNWLIKTGNKTKIIISTATPCEDPFDELSKSKLIRLDSTQFPVTVHWNNKNYFSAKNKFDKKDLENAALTKFDHVFKEYEGDILIITSGENEVESLCEKIRKKKPNICVFPLYSSLPHSEIKIINEPCDTRKVIVATNIAETGITISGVTCVINMMTHKKVSIVSKRQIRVIEETLISKASFKQREGRAGRTQPGHHFPLCTEDFYENKLTKYIENEFTLIQKHIPILSLLSFDFPADKILMISPKEYKNLLEELFNMNLIDFYDYSKSELPEVTKLGKQVSKFPLSLKGSISLVKGKELLKNDFYELLHLLIAVIMIDTKISCPHVFYVPRTYRKNRKVFINSGIYDDYNASNDVTILIKIFCDLMMNNFDEKTFKIKYLSWCKKKNITIKFIEFAYRLFNQVYYLIFKNKTLRKADFEYIFNNCEMYVDTMTSIFRIVYNDCFYTFKKKEPRISYGSKSSKNTYYVDNYNICSMWTYLPKKIIALSETQILGNGKKPFILLSLCLPFN